MPFNPIVVADSDLNRVQHQVQTVVAQLETRLAALEAKPHVDLVSFLVNGKNGALPLTLPATAGRVALVGAKVVLIVNLSDLANLHTPAANTTDFADARAKFASTITVQSQIQQIDPSNLSTTKFLIVVQNG